VRAFGAGLLLCATGKPGGLRRRFLCRCAADCGSRRFWRAAGRTGAAGRRTGAENTPLQPPTEVDLADHLSFANYPYWTQKAQRS
jgi:hypothetical protein